MIKKLILFFLIATLFIGLVSCASDDDSNATNIAVEDINMPDYKPGQTITLNVYNWGEYISDGSEGTLDVNAAFEEYFNSTLSLLPQYNGVRVKVEYSTYPTNEDMYSKLKNSAVSYDIIIPSDYMIQKLIEEGMLLSFDTSSLSNYKNISESFKNAYYDESNCYSVPYTYGMMGIIYNKELVDPKDVEDKSWGLMWNEKYAGNILQYNNPRDAFATAMYWKGLDINSDDPDVWNDALELLKAQKPLLQGYVNDEIFNKMKSESAAIASYFVGDFLIMAEEEENLAFYYPREGVNYFVDAMCIPSCSSNPHIAKEYINFMIGEKAAVANATYIGYASPNTAVIENDEYIEAMNEYAYQGGENGEENAYDLLYNYTPDVVNARYNELYSDIVSPACYRSFPADIQTHVNTLWEDLKISGSTELWVHITSIIIVVAVIAFAVYSIYVKKIRSKDYRMRDKQKLLEKRAKARENK